MAAHSRVSTRMALGYYLLFKSKHQPAQQPLPLVHRIDQVQCSQTKAVLDRIYEANRRLIQHSDKKTQAILEKQWNELERLVQQSDVRTQQDRETLLTVSSFYNFHFAYRRSEHGSIDSRLILAASVSSEGEGGTLIGMDPRHSFLSISLCCPLATCVHVHVLCFCASLSFSSRSCD